MGFFDFLKGKDGQLEWKKTLIKDLVMLSAVDGEMDKEELDLTLKIAVNELGFTEKEFVNLMQNLGEVKDVYPENSDKKLEYMLSLMRMTYSDGYVDENEISYMKIIANKMGLPEDGVQKAMSIMENETSGNANMQSNNDEQNTFSDDSSIGKILITSPFEPTIDVQSEEGIHNYLAKVSKFSILELSIELSNVLSAKYNKMSVPSGINTFSETQKIVTDLTDKALLLCYVAFGMEKVLNYSNQDTRIFNQLVNDIDKEVASLNLPPAAHGKKIFDKIAEVIGK